MIPDPCFPNDPVRHFESSGWGRADRLPLREAEQQGSSSNRRHPDKYDPMTSLAHYHQLRSVERGRYAESPADQRLEAAAVASLRALIDAVGRYDGSQSSEFIDVDPIRQDVAIGSLCETYREGNDDVRAFLRWSIDPPRAWGLITFSKRAAVRGLQNADPTPIRTALLALAIENLANGDVRDDLVAIGLVHHCAAAIHADPAAMFEEAAILAGDAMAAVLRDFILRTDLDRIAKAMGFRQVKSQGKIGFRW